MVDEIKKDKFEGLADKIIIFVLIIAGVMIGLLLFNQTDASITKGEKIIVQGIVEARQLEYQDHNTIASLIGFTLQEKQKLDYINSCEVRSNSEIVNDLNQSTGRSLLTMICPTGGQ